MLFNYLKIMYKLLRRIQKLICIPTTIEDWDLNKKIKLDIAKDQHNIIPIN